MLPSRTSPPALLRSPIPTATIVVATVIVLLPNHNLTTAAPYDDQRLVQVGALTIVTLWVAAFAPVREHMARLVQEHRRLWAVVGIAFIVGLMSAAMAPDPFTGLLEVALLAALILLMLAVAAEEVIWPGRTTATILGAVGLATTFQLLPLLALPDLSDGVHELWRRSGWAGAFDHPRFLNQFQAMAIPLLGGLCCSSRRVVRLPAYAITTVTAWSLVLTEGRGATLAVATVLLALAVTGGPIGRRWARATAAPVIAGAVAALVTRRLVGLSGVLISRDLTSSSGRTFIWSDAIQRAVESPVLGVGPGHLAHDAVVPVIFRPALPAHPHNVAIQLLAEWGIPAAAGLLAVVAVAGVAMLRRPVAKLDTTPLAVEGPVVTVATTAAVGAGLLLSLVSGVAVMPTAQTVLAAVAGLAIAQRESGTDPATGTSPTSTGAGWTLAAIMVVATTVLLVEVGPHPVADRRDSDAAFDDASDSDIRDPRFWRQGIRGIDSGAGGPAG